MNAIRETYHHIRNFSSTFWVVIAATLMNQLGNMAFIFIVIYLNKYLGFSLSQSSFSFVIFSTSMMVAGMFGGPFVDRYGSSRLMIVSLLINGLILISFPFIHRYDFILFFCVLWGLTYGIYRPASQTFVSKLSSPGMHKITFSVYRLAINLGMSIGPAVGGFLAAHSFKAIFFVNGTANILASLMLTLGLGRKIWLKASDTTVTNHAMNLSWLKKDNVLRIFILGMIPISMVFYQHVSMLPIFLSHTLNLPLSFYGLLFTLNTSMIVFFELPLNVATLQWSYRMNFVVGSIFTTIGFAGYAFAKTPLEVIILTICWTIGEMILYPAASSYIADIATEDRRGSYMSLFSVSSNLGMMFGPWGGALIMQHFGTVSLWLTCGLTGLLSICLFMKTPELNQTAAETAA